MGALDGILVADFSRVMAGPQAGMTLGDFGANVIKVESPSGDETRDWKPPVDDEGRATYYLAVNRNKHSVSLDLKDPGDLKLARELVRRADVVIENFKPGTMERFGLDYATVKSDNEGLVYCSITGFGTDKGKALPGYDPLVQALSGLMSITGFPDGEASRVGVALIDVIAGLNATTGILAALRVRDATGAGQHVEINLLATALAALANQATSYLNTGVTPQRLGNTHPSIEPFSTFATADSPIMICAGNDRHFALMAEVLGVPGLAEDERFSSNGQRVVNRGELRAEMEVRLIHRNVAEWVKLLSTAGVPAGPVNDIAGGFELAGQLGLDVVDELAGVRTVASPIGLSDTPAETRLAPPALDGQGTEIRAWLANPQLG